MNKLIKTMIDFRIEIILKEFNFQNRRYEHLDECPCNGSSPCHDIKDLNCLLCYCPWYDNSNPEGGCKIENPLKKGKWFYREGNEISDKVWDCSDCIYPHQEKIVRETLTKLFNGELNL
jgi:Zn-finger protein